MKLTSIFIVFSDPARSCRYSPWIVQNHYLTIRKWEPNFKPSEAKDISMAIWLWFPKLPIYYYEKNALFHIAKRLSKPIKTDFNTATSTKGKYAMVCV